MTTTNAFRLASVVTAINVLVATGFTIAAIFRPEVRGASRLDSNGGVVAIGDVRGGAHNSASFVYIGGNLQTSDVCVADPGHARGRQPIAGCRNRSVST